MSSTHDEILRTIKAQGRVSVAELAERLNITPVSVRHHLSTLLAEGLVKSTEVRQGVGRPRLVFTLSEAGQERFPARYLRLSERLLDELKSTLPPRALEDMFTRMAEGMVAEYSARLAGKSIEEKLSVLIEVLGTEGFLAKWNRTGETISLTEYSCPYLRIGQRHPEVCAIDQNVIQQLLNASVEKTTCVLNGADRCVFVISPGEIHV
jgi:DeoR family transcriptional regulator, suf operon transcriptional repressor